MDIIKLKKADGTTEEVEIVMTFVLEKFNNNDYVIYKDKDNQHYGAKYVENDGNISLDTDLTEEEKEALTNIYTKLLKGDIV